MQTKSRQELYRDFIEFISLDLKKERSEVNRRMMNVFFWCFLVPTVSSISILVLIKMKVMPRTARNFLDWIVLIAPVCYSLYILSSEVLAPLRKVFKKGSGMITLQQSLKEGEWRERTCESMAKTILAKPEEWDWIVASFKIDLQEMQYRTKYLTALGGSVFFLIMQGIDSLTDGEGKVSWIKTSVLGWIETSSNDMSQYVGLTLFLVLLYLSGSQTDQSLKRYLNCAELMVRSRNSKNNREN